MRMFIILILVLTLAGCTVPGDLASAADKDWSFSGVCDIDFASWLIDHDASQGETTFMLRIEGGDCTVDE